jgi:hypothetical protein
VSVWHARLDRAVRVELEDPATGRGVTVGGRAHMHQRCRICHPIAAVDGARTGGVPLGWFHLSHLADVLAIATPTRERRRAS